MVTSADKWDQVELDGVVHAGITLPVNVPALLACVLEGLPNTVEPAELEVVAGLLTVPGRRCGLVERPLVGGTVIALRTGIGLRLEGLSERCGEVYNLQTDRASGVVGESSEIRSPGEVVTDRKTAQSVLVIVITESNG